MNLDVHRTNLAHALAVNYGLSRQTGQVGKTKTARQQPVAHTHAAKHLQTPGNTVFSQWCMH